MPQGEITIRKFTPKDRQIVRDIAHDTAFMGDPADVFFTGKKIISDALTLYFTDYEPESCFIAEAEGEVAGYLIGAKNKLASEKIIAEEISMFLLLDALASGIFLRKKNIIFLYNVLSGMVKGEFKLPELTMEYPATFHINIKEAFRGLDIGSKLIEAYLNYLKEEKIEGVHLATMSDGAAKFFSKQGFVLLYSGRRSYFRHILRKDVPVYIYAKKL